MQIVSIVPVALVAGLFSTFSLSTPPPQDPTPQATTDFVLEPGTHNIRDLIDRAAKYLKRNYVYSETDLASTPDQDVMLQNKLVLDAVGCNEVVSQLAFTKGLLMLPIDEKRGIYEWIFMQGQNRSKISSHVVEMTPQQVLRSRNLRIPVRTTYLLQEFDSNQVVNQLRPFLLAHNQGILPSMTIGSAGNALLLQGFAHEVASAIEMIEKLDGPAPELEPGLSTWKARVDQRLDAIEKALRR